MFHTPGHSSADWVPSHWVPPPGRRSYSESTTKPHEKQKSFKNKHRQAVDAILKVTVHRWGQVRKGLHDSRSPLPGGPRV